MSKSTGYVSMMQARMKKWDADVLALDKAGAKARARYQEKVRGLRASRDLAHRTLAKHQAARQSANAQMHAGVQKAKGIMQAALRKMAADLDK